MLVRRQDNVRAGTWGESNHEIDFNIRIGRSTLCVLANL